jgi:signal transduction histidine kinase
MLGVFVCASFVAIFGTTLLFSNYMASYLGQQLMEREASISAEFLNSTVQVEEATRFFFGARMDPEVPEMEEFFNHVASMPAVFRANVYSSTGEILWSSDRELIGRRFTNNQSLMGALRGEVQPELGVLDRGQKAEHVGLPDYVTQFVEYYIPIWSRDGRQVVGAVEVYKAPSDLLRSIENVQFFARIGGLIAGLALFSMLLVVVLYTGWILYRQEKRLIETERLAVVGEMASTVAHGLRNPLAAIRSCAELVSEDAIPDESRRTVQDIIDQVDRLEAWIRSFLIRTREDPRGEQEVASVEKVVRQCIENFRPQMEKRGIHVQIEEAVSPMQVSASAAELEQVMSSIIANGIEAMNDGGTLTVGWQAAPGGRVSIRIADTGPGISSEQMEKIFVPFETSKSSGLGIGLALARRIAERLGGTLDLRNRGSALRGVEVILSIPSRS